MHGMRADLIAVALTVVAGLPQTAAAEQVVVFAAASLKTALDAVAADFTAATGDDVLISYAGSNLLAAQIIAGAPADLFLSASEAWMDEVAAAGLVVPGTRRDLLGNTLVLIAHGTDAAPVAIGPELDLAGLLDGGKLAMALVDSVPAGQYGKAALTMLGLWDAVQQDVAQTDNVRAALALVAAGEAPLGIVYASDALAEPGVSVIATFPPDSHPPIVFPVALLTNATDPADADFLAALSERAAIGIFAAQGFAPLQ